MGHDAGPSTGPSRTRQPGGRRRQLQAQAAGRLLAARESHASMRLLADALREDRDTGGALLAGALAFRLFLWLLPASLLAVAVLGFSSPDRVRSDLTGAGLGGFAASTVAQASAQAHQARWILLLIAVVALYTTSVGLAKAMWIGTSLAWHLPVAKLRRPPKAAGAVVGLLVPAVAVSLAANWLRSVAYPAGVVFTLVLIVLYALFGWVVLRMLPRPPTASALDLIPGAILIGGGIQVLHLVSAFYLIHRLSTSSQLYGALGGAAVLLLWGYLLARVLIAASTVNHTLFRYRDAARLRVGDDVSQPVSIRDLPSRLRADWRGIAAAVTPDRTSAPSEGSATLTVWLFEDEDGAERASRPLAELERQGHIRVIDAAVVTWPVGARRPRTSQLPSTTAAGALGGSFWGLLFGIIFFAPLLGLAVGAAAGALGGSMREMGIGDEFIRQVRDEVTPGTSALFVMTSDAVMDEVRNAFLVHHPRLIHTNLTPEQDAALHDFFRA